jgi:hypothetical protein
MSRNELSAAIRNQLDDMFVDEEHGSLDDAPHMRMVLIRDGTELADNLDDNDLETDDIRYLESCEGGVIVTILRDGTYSVRYFTSEDAIEDQWADLCADLDSGVAPATIRSLDTADDGDEGVGAPDEDEDEDEDEDDDDEEEIEEEE